MDSQLKKRSLTFFTHGLLLCTVFGVTRGESTNDRMFTNVRGSNCVRLLNGTHQRGCSSKLFGSAGALHLIRIVEDFEFILRNPPAPPYAPIIPPHLFTRENILRLKNEGQHNISVVVLINQVDKMTHFSHELACPNQYSGILLPNSTETATCNTRNADLSWNPWGTGLMHEDFPFPIYYVSDKEEIDKLLDCFNKFNNFDYDNHAKRSLCAVEVKAFMTAAVNSEVCYRRSKYPYNLSITRYCDPLGDHNVYATLYPRNKTETGEASSLDDSRKIDPNEKFILISCRMDTTSMFESLGLGAKDSLIGYVTLLSLANTIKQYLPSNYNDLTRKLNLIFVVFNGESFDYIGSQSFVYDMENLDIPPFQTETTPISFENIELMIDIGTLDETSTINIHTLNATERAKSFTTLINLQSRNFNVDYQLSEGINLPPTSAQSFLRKMPTFPALILNAKPTNKYYHSIYDDANNVNFTYGNYTKQNYTRLMATEEALKYFTSNSIQIKIRNVSSSLALALTNMLYSDERVNGIYASPILIDELLYCFLKSSDCRLFKDESAVSSLEALTDPPPRYVSVEDGLQAASGWTYRLMGLLLSSVKNNISKQNCDEMPSLLWMNGQTGVGECRQTTHYYSHALSPAFLIENYDWKSGEYSTWTESTWSPFSTRIFLRPSKTHEVMTLSIGIVVLIISFCLVYIISSRSDVLFEGATTSSDTLTAPTAC
ncbi:nicastrin [Eurosta solidaginis]|uniref:nicastrin n=1 Tax=Eurosta solidaginis TaxID=178769 RepID=UPI003530C94E